MNWVMKLPRQDKPRSSICMREFVQAQAFQAESSLVVLLSSSSNFFSGSGGPPYIFLKDLYLLRQYYNNVACCVLCCILSLQTGESSRSSSNGKCVMSGIIIKRGPERIIGILAYFPLLSLALCCLLRTSLCL